MNEKTILRSMIWASLLVVVYMYASAVWYAEPYAHAQIFGLDDRPFVYRALMPWIGRGLFALGFRATTSLGILTFGSAIVLVYSLMYLSETFKPKSENDLIKACSGVELFCMLAFRFCKVYDLPAAITFALGLAFMARGKWREYFLVFLLGCLNRETTLLLTLVFAVYCFGKFAWWIWLSFIASQVLIFAAVRVLVVTLFAGSPGSAFWFRPLENLQVFAASPWLSLLHWSGVVFVVWLCLRGWKQKAILLRTAFVILAPVSLVLYLVLGNAFELRVFAEVFPVIWMLVF